jgi:hypothetical protein
MANAAPQGLFSACFELNGGIKKSTEVFGSLNGQRCKFDDFQ